MKTTEQKKSKVLKGKVSSLSGMHTIKVTFTESVTHPIYKKRYTKTRSRLAHCTDSSVSVGDTVTISEIKPMSKHKHWQVVEIVDRVHVVSEQASEDLV